MYRLNKLDEDKFIALKNKRNLLIDEILNNSRKLDETNSRKLDETYRELGKFLTDNLVWYPDGLDELVKQCTDESCEDEK